jgi:hypothetical protein
MLKKKERRSAEYRKWARKLKKKKKRKEKADSSQILYGSWQW